MVICSLLQFATWVISCFIWVTLISSPPSPNPQASPAFNDYTPLIFLASTPPSANGHQVAQAMELLITSRADVHRECGQMFSGRLVPLRFAARAQNEYGLAAGALLNCAIWCGDGSIFSVPFLFTRGTGFWPIPMIFPWRCIALFLFACFVECFFQIRAVW